MPIVNKGFHTTKNLERTFYCLEVAIGKLICNPPALNDEWLSSKTFEGRVLGNFVPKRVDACRADEI